MPQDSMQYWMGEIYKWCQRKGWNDDLDKRSFGDWTSLLHSEITEAYEHYRDGHGLDEVLFDESKTLQHPEGHHLKKPDGVPIEIADLLIRVFHLCAHLKLDPGALIQMKMDYNEARAYRHGGKVT